MKTADQPQLMEALDALRRQWRTRKVLEGSLLLLAGGLVVLVAVVAADNLFHLERTGRLFLAFTLWGALAVGMVGLVIRRWLEDRRDDYFAALVEQKNPQLHNLLINALQLSRQHHNGYSPYLIQAIVKDANEATAELEMSSSLDARPAWRALVLALAALLLVGGYAAAFSTRFANGLSRVLLPVADIPAYTATQVVEASVKPGDTRVPEGASVTVEAKVKGVIPATAQLVRESAGKQRQSSVMPPDRTAADTFRYTVGHVNESFDYGVLAGDGRSRLYHVEVVKRPQIAGLSLTFSLPSYTALPPREVADSDGEISGIPGTRVDFDLKASKPLKEASLITEKGDVVSLQKGADDHTWHSSFVLWKQDAKPVPEITGQLLYGPTRYRIKLLDTDGYENADPLWRSVSLARDQAPTVAISAPGRDLQVKPDAVVSLTLDAKDDYGVNEMRLLYRVNEEQSVRELARFPHEGPPELETSDHFDWNLASGKLKAGDVVQYWAAVNDRNNLTGPGQGESRRFSIFLVAPEEAVARLDLQIQDYVQMLEELLRLQQENRAQTTAGAAFDNLVKRQTDIRTKTSRLARAMEKDALPVVSIVKSLDDLAAGLMANAVKVMETGRDTADQARAADLRKESLPIQDQIIAELAALLTRLQRNEQAKEALRKLEKTDKPGHDAIAKTLNQMVKDMDQMLKDQAELASKFEKLRKKPVDDLKEDSLKGMKDLEEFQKKWEKWTKGTVNELTKLPEGFVKDYDLRPDVNKIYEEIEKAASRPKAQKMEVSLEDLGAGLATKMMEDLEMWMPDSPDATKWVLEEPLNKKPMKIPEMPLPKALEDMIGDLLQKADEFDEEADDVTSAWGDNLNQAGWGVGDGPISTFSAKGKTGNDLPNNMELSGRSGEGRRGKSSGQMVGDTVKGLPGRPTPARVTAEQYEPGQLKQEGQLDPTGATGGGKKSGTGRIGLQGGAPPDFVRDIGRLGEKQAGLREKAEQVAQKLDTLGIGSRRLNESIDLMKSAEKDLRDLRYEDAARKRRVALGKLQTALTNVDQTTAVQLSNGRDLPPQLRNELLQAADDGYPAGYESLLNSYFKALSTAGK